MVRPCWPLAAALALGVLAPAGLWAKARPNVVLILVDDLGWTGLSCYGSDLHETPRIDRLARQSLRFTDAYAAAPVCSPTRASIMAGKSPARLHITIWYESSGKPRPSRRKLIPPTTEGNLPLSEVTLAEALEGAGYFTAHVGKWHLGDAAHYPENQGFDVNVAGTFWGCPPTYFYPYRGLFGKELRYVPGLPFGAKGEYLTDRLTDEALKIIDRAGDGPFFLNLCYHTVHTPIEGKPDLVAHYRKKLREGLKHVNAEYAAMHHALDANVGRVLDALERKGLADNTIVILTSDNGGFVNAYKGKRVTTNEPLRSGKGSLYEGGVRIPLMVRWPGVTPAGKVCREPVVTTDLYPTLLEATGVKGDAAHNAGLEGLSLVPLLKDPGKKLPRGALFFHYPHYYPTTSPVSAVRARDWKLLHFYEGDRVELYHLSEDLGEKNDLAGKMPAKAAELKGLLDGWLRKAGAQLPRPNPAAR
jgi:arylsulfatase A